MAWGEGGEGVVDGVLKGAAVGLPTPLRAGTRRLEWHSSLPAAPGFHSVLDGMTRSMAPRPSRGGLFRVATRPLEGSIHLRPTGANSVAKRPSRVTNSRLRSRHMPNALPTLVMIVARPADSVAGNGASDLACRASRSASRWPKVAGRLRAAGA